MAVVGDTAFGTVFNGLVDAVLEATTRVTTFSSSLDSLKTTLVPLKCYFDQVKTLNRKLHSPQRETDMFILRLAEGETLVRKCTRIKWWQLYKKYSYSKKIDDLERSLLRFFQLDVQAEMVRDHKMILVGEADLHKQLNAVNHKLDQLNAAVNPKLDQLNAVNHKLDQLLSVVKNIVQEPYFQDRRCTALGWQNSENQCPKQIDVS